MIYVGSWFQGIAVHPDGEGIEEELNGDRSLFRNFSYDT